MAEVADTERQRGRADVATAIILSAAGLLSAWAAFQSNLWAGVQAAAFAEANVLRTEAARLDIESRQLRESRQALVHSWLEAAAVGDARRMQFFESHLTDAQRNVFDAWRARLPADLATYQRQPGTPPLPLPDVLFEPPVERDRALADANRQFARGEAASATSGRFVFANVLLSLVLFLAGISQVTRPLRPRLVVLAFSALILVGTTLFLAGLPRASL